MRRKKGGQGRIGKCSSCSITINSGLTYFEGAGSSDTISLDREIHCTLRLRSRLDPLRNFLCSLFSGVIQALIGLIFLGCLRRVHIVLGGLAQRRSLHCSS